MERFGLREPQACYGFRIAESVKNENEIGI